METWKAAYIIVIVIILTGIIKYENERYYHNKKIQIAKEAKQLSTHALIRARADPTPANLKHAEMAAFHSNQAETSDNYDETVKHAVLAVQHATAF